MENFFQRNLLVLSQRNPELCSSLFSGVKTGSGIYQFIESRSGEIIPAWAGSTARPLHSAMDPRKEAKRLLDTVQGEGFLVLLGLGGGYYAEAALERKETCAAVVVEYGIGGLAELLCRRDYTRLFDDPRFFLFVDMDEGELIRQILNLYQPALHGGIRVIPLRSRTEHDTDAFTGAGKAIGSAIEKVSADYSVQAHFGKRWFSNIIRNLKNAAGDEGTQPRDLPPVRRAAVCAAGPSLSLQIERLRESRNDRFLIAADTSLPCLLAAGISPDAVISIDCQHISYYHFMERLPKETLLFLDLASPPLLSALSKTCVFLSGGHPLTHYISRAWKPLPELDISGGNVTYAALSLAEQLGAEEIELYGADFAYPGGVSYARGAYIYSFFEKRQNRLAPLEAQHSAFLFRTALEKIRPGSSWYYETGTLKFYREKLEEKSSLMAAALIPVEGRGAPILINQGGSPRQKADILSFGKVPVCASTMSADDFLAQYRNDIAALPAPVKNAADYLQSLNRETSGRAVGSAHAVFTTLLPAAAALRRQYPQADFRELFEELRKFCLGVIDKVRA